MRIDTFTRPCAIAADYFVSKAGLQFALPQATPLHVFGYSCDRVKSRAEFYARCEAIERLYTNRELLAARSHRISTLSYPDLTPTDPCDSGRPAFVGTAFHSSRRLAFTAAITELCERYVLNRMWFTGQPRLHPLAPPWSVSDAVTLEDFQVSETDMIVTSLCDRRRQIFVCGSAARESAAESAAHAAAEAIMLHDALVVGDAPMYRSSQRRAAFATLRGPDSALREERFRALIDNRRPLAGGLSITAVLRAQESVLVHLVYEARNACVALAELRQTPLSVPHGDVAPPFF